MNKRVTIEMPEEMHELLLKYAAEAGTEPNAYLLDIIEERLEDAYFLQRAEEAMERIEGGESKVISAEEFWRGLDD
jgi:Predicted DNA-binding protein with an HTH domain